MEELRKEYEGLKLDDYSILKAKSLGLNPEMVKVIRENFSKLVRDLNEAMAAIQNILQEPLDPLAEKMKKIAEDIKKLQEQQLVQAKRNKKGKPLKPWQKNSFYQ